MSQYLPSFDRYAKGKFNSDTGFIAVKCGTKAILLEDELNEIQWIQAEARAEIIKKISKSGCINIPQPNDATKPGGIEFLDNAYLNTFSLKGFDAILDGHIAHIDTDYEGGFKIELEDAPIVDKRYDFVYLEFWFKELKAYEPVPKFGGFNNAPITYEIIDDRMNIETTRRVQLQWNIKTLSDVTYPDIINYKLDNINIYPQGPNPIENKNYKFSVDSKDNLLFTAGDETDSSKIDLATLDGKIYAIPLLVIKRLNKSGYNPRYNPNGGVDYVDENSVSGRPDNKFSNIIYEDDIIDIRHLTPIGEEQLEQIFVKTEDFDDYKDSIKNDVKDVLANVSTELNELKDQVDATNTNFNLELDEVNKKMADLQTQINDTSKIEAAVNSCNARIDSLLTTINSYNTNIAQINARISAMQTDINAIYSGSTVADLVLYNLDQNRKTITTIGGTLQSDGTILSTGVLTNVTFTNKKDYSVMYTPIHSDSTISDGTIGDIWIERADTNFILKNSGAQGLLCDTFAIKNDRSVANKYVWSNAAIDNYAVTKFAGINSFTRIDIPLRKDSDLVFITPIQNYTGEVGEVYVKLDSNGFNVYNTGSAGDEFEWTVIDTTSISNGGRLKNILVYDIDLPGYDGVYSQSGQFGGDSYNVLISTPMIHDISNITLGGIGDISISKNTGYFTIFNTGESIGSIRCILFKKVSSTNTDDSNTDVQQITVSNLTAETLATKSILGQTIVDDSAKSFINDIIFDDKNGLGGNVYQDDILKIDPVLVPAPAEVEADDITTVSVQSIDSNSISAKILEDTINDNTDKTIIIDTTMTNPKLGKYSNLDTTNSSIDVTNSNIDGTDSDLTK